MALHLCLPFGIFIASAAYSRTSMLIKNQNDGIHCQTLPEFRFRVGAVEIAFLYKESHEKSHLLLV